MTTIIRVPDWPERLVAFIEARRFMPFAWGQNDCALFAADGILDFTGVDIAKSFRGYTTERRAARILARAGGMEVIAGDLFPEKAVGLAGRGDVIIATLEGRDTFGLVSGGGYWCGPGLSGLLFRPLSDARKAYMV